MNNHQFKQKLSFNEIVNYITTINDSVDEDFFTNFLRDEYGEDSYAILKELSVHDLKPDSHKENHLVNNKTQLKYNKLSSFDPILVNSNYLILDGHHRYRAHLSQNKNTIMAYVVIDQDNI